MLFSPMPDPQIRYEWTIDRADRLRLARRAKGKISLYALTQRLRKAFPSMGINQMEKYQKGKWKSISAELLIAICEELEVSLEYILEGEKDKSWSFCDSFDKVFYRCRYPKEACKF
jgi:DNA-binding Xre family transcriptional regulator